MRTVGLTGSIAMGKSETAKMFRRLGVPVLDADAVVHALYAKGGEAVPLIAARFPDAVVDAAVDRQRLSSVVVGDEQAMRDLEGIVHPLVRAREKEFLEHARKEGRRLVLLDIPLLYETGRDGEMDAVVVVTAPEPVQIERALKRPGMTREKLSAILARQLPDSEKRRRAHHVIDTGAGFDQAFEQVRAVVDALLMRKDV
ncbi:MAG: dephospho-CoA kinase [Parvibaculaceae bacterium]